MKREETFFSVSHFETPLPPSTFYLPPVTRNYTFSAKERDTETGYSYFGSRYYSSDLSIWLSVDPQSDKYPSFSPYVYCANNPIKLVDPNGEEYGIPPWLLIKGVARIVEATSDNPDVKTVAYAINHPINAMHVKFDYNIAATNFQVNIGKAINCTKNTEGSPQNAIRHTLWQALITRDVGSAQAKRIGAAHEDNTPVDINQRYFSSLSTADKAADLLNNKIGRNIGEINKSANNKEMAKHVMKEYLDNGLWTVDGDEKTGYMLSRTRISKEQYNAAIKEINKKGENGLNMQ